MSSQSNNTTLNSYYERLAFDLDDGDAGHFLSGWQCENPYVSDFLDLLKEKSSSIDYRKYQYFDEDEKLPEKILNLHSLFDGQRPQEVLCASGSTSLLYAFVTYLKRLKVKKVYYISPIYFTLHVAFELYDIESVPVTTKQPFENDFLLNLPEESSSILFLTDPIWFTGTKFKNETIDEIINWQKRTSSFVFIDGSLQYLPWDGILNERTANLDPKLTFRLVCPSKQLSIHGYRFSYLLLPKLHERGMAWTYANIAGPASADSIIFAHEAINAIVDRNIPNKLMRAASEKYLQLHTNKVIESVLSPECGYFVFEKIKCKLPRGYTVMDGKYFDLKNYQDYIKINLLSPSINILSNISI